MTSREQVAEIYLASTAKTVDLLKPHAGPGYTARMNDLATADTESDADRVLVQVAMLSEMVAQLALVVHQQRDELEGLRESVEQRSEETADTLVFVSRLLRALHEKLDAQQLVAQRKESNDGKP